MKLLSVAGLRAEIGGKEIIREVSFEVGKSELVGLTGENGSGKTSLARVLLGSGELEVGGGSVKLEGKDLFTMKVEERVRVGLYVSWQNPIAVPGVSVFNLCKASYVARGLKIESLVAFRAKLEELLEQVGLPKSYVSRGVNEGMSGGERKRLELMMLLLLKPKLVVLDEIDSGMDEVGRETVVKLVKQMNQEGVAFIIISHYGEFLKRLGIKKILVMEKGRIV